MSRRRLLDLAGALVAAALAYWAYSRADLQAIAATFRAGDAAWIAAALAVLLAGHALRVFRWSRLCRSAGRAPQAAAIAAPFGLLAVTLLPFRIGEGMRLALQRRLDPGAGVAELVGLTLVERAGDLLGILLLIAVGTAAAGELHFAAALAAGLAAAAVVLVASKRAASNRLASNRAALRPPAGGLAGKGLAFVSRLAGLLLVQRPAALAQMALASVAAWFGDAAAIYCLGRAFGAALPAAAATASAGWVALGVALPTAPAGLGTHQAILAWALPGSATLEQAIAISLGMIASIIVVQAALGSFAALALMARRQALAASRID